MLKTTFAQCMYSPDGVDGGGGGAGERGPAWKNEGEKSVFDAAFEFSRSASVHADRFFRLILTIRETQLIPERVQALLEAASLPKPVISQVRAVSEVSESLWKDYKNRFIGFKAAYSKAVQEKRGQRGPAWHVSRFYCDFASLVKRVEQVPVGFHHEGLNHLLHFHVSDIKGEITTFTSQDWVVKISRRGNENTKTNTKKPTKTKVKA